MGLGSSIASTKQLAMAERCSITNTKVRHLGAGCVCTAAHCHHEAAVHGFGVSIASMTVAPGRGVHILLSSGVSPPFVLSAARLCGCCQVSRPPFVSSSGHLHIPDLLLE